MKLNRLKHWWKNPENKILYAKIILYSSGFILLGLLLIIIAVMIASLLLPN
jgi:hypothetical protein